MSNEEALYSGLFVFAAVLFQPSAVQNGTSKKSVRIPEYTFSGDPCGWTSATAAMARGFVHALSVTRAPRDAKELANAAGHIHSKARFGTEFTAGVTDVPLQEANDRHRFVRDRLREVGIELSRSMVSPFGPPSSTNKGL
jgi:hypothetical protein